MTDSGQTIAYTGLPDTLDIPPLGSMRNQYSITRDRPIGSTSLSKSKRTERLGRPESAHGLLAPSELQTQLPRTIFANLPEAGGGHWRRSTGASETAG
jgi:hypothetical protein